jgi:hypothetical protein
LVERNVNLETQSYEHGNIVAENYGPVGQHVSGLGIPITRFASPFFAAGIHLIRDKNSVLPDRNKEPNEHNSGTFSLDLRIVINVPYFINHPE